MNATMQHWYLVEGIERGLRVLNLGGIVFDHPYVDDNHRAVSSRIKSIGRLPSGDLSIVTRSRTYTTQGIMLHTIDDILVDPAWELPENIELTNVSLDDIRLVTVEPGSAYEANKRLNVSRDTLVVGNLEVL